MLVLTRKVDEDILVGDGITIKVISINKNQVKLGIEAGDSIKIYRKEIYQAVSKSNNESVHPLHATVQNIAKEIDSVKAIALVPSLKSIKRK